MKNNDKLKIMILGTFTVICAIAFIGAAYSQFATYESVDNSTGNDYVTITMTTNDDQPVSDGIMFRYVQDYDTYTDHDNSITYRMLCEDDSKFIQLNESPYKFTINSNDGEGTYKVSAKMPGVHQLFEDHSKTKQCYFILELKNNENTYQTTAVPNSNALIQFTNIDPLKSSNLSTGTYEFNVYLKMFTTPIAHAMSDWSIVVDKEFFVDQFTVTDVSITFRAEPPE